MVAYPEYLAAGRQIGSGPTESMCKATTMRLRVWECVGTGQRGGGHGAAMRWPRAASGRRTGSTAETGRVGPRIICRAQIGASSEINEATGMPAGLSRRDNPDGRNYQSLPRTVAAVWGQGEPPGLAADALADEADTAIGEAGHDAVGVRRAGKTAVALRLAPLTIRGAICGPIGGAGRVAGVGGGDDRPPIRPVIVVVATGIALRQLVGVEDRVGGAVPEARGVAQLVKRPEALSEDLPVDAVAGGRASRPSGCSPPGRCRS